MDYPVAVVGPRLVDATGQPELSFGPMIGPINEIRQQWRAARNVTALTASRSYPDWVSGACLLVRRADAEAVGLLDERFFMYTRRRRFLRVDSRPSDGGSCSRPTWRSCICAAVRAPARRPRPNGPIAAVKSPFTKSIIRAGCRC